MVCDTKESETLCHFLPGREVHFTLGVCLIGLKKSIPDPEENNVYGNVEICDKVTFFLFVPLRERFRDSVVVRRIVWRHRDQTSSTLLRPCRDPPGRPSSYGPGAVLRYHPRAPLRPAVG